MKETYILTYNLYLLDNSYFLNKKMKVKNCSNELHAKIKFGEYMKTKYKDFSRLEIVDIRKDFLSSTGFNNIFGSTFGDIFK